jgi:hypothetical protein
MTQERSIIARFQFSNKRYPVTLNMLFCCGDDLAVDVCHCDCQGIRADPLNAFSALAGFSGKALTVTLSLIEQSLDGKTADN